jgi:hypothetical protein
MKNYLCVIVCLILFSCGKNEGPSNEELLEEATKTAQWNSEATVELVTNEDRKSVVIFIDTLMLDMKTPNKFTKYEESVETDEFNFIYNSKMGGYLILNGQTTTTTRIDLEDTFDFSARESSGKTTITDSNYSFSNFHNSNYFVHGTLISKTEIKIVEYSTLQEKVIINGGLSYKNGAGVHNIAFRIERQDIYKPNETSSTTSFSAIVNGVEFKGDLNVE